MNSYNSIKFGNITLLEDITEIPYENAFELFPKLRHLSTHNFLFESKDISDIYGRLSLIGIDPVLKITAKDNQFQIKTLNDRAQKYLDKVLSNIKEQSVDFHEQELIKGKIIQEQNKFCEETQRTQQKNITQVIRTFIKTFKTTKKSSLGLYGTFTYDMIRLFEELPEILPETDIPDFTLCLYDTFIYFDHLKERSEIILYRNLDEPTNEYRQNITEQLSYSAPPSTEFSIINADFDLSQEEYQKNVETAKDLARRGELFEVVFSNKLEADFEGDSYALYLKYRETNPSPYLFYVNVEDEQLVGASPEMMVRCEHDRVQLRPISGTAKRGKDPVEDHENMLSLLNCPKERAELDMLIDLGRNDLSRICEPGIEVSDYRFVEKYSSVMHTVAHLSGKLRKEFTAFDALVACLNAGTLTGAPKVAAMSEIEKHEKSRRGYYGGAVGYLTFAGDMDTGIIIRTAHIKNGRLSFRVGATLLYDSIPEKEYQETLSKALAFMNTFMDFQKKSENPLKVKPPSIPIPSQS